MAEQEAVHTIDDVFKHLESVDEKLRKEDEQLKAVAQKLADKDKQFLTVQKTLADEKKEREAIEKKLAEDERKLKTISSGTTPSGRFQVRDTDADVIKAGTLRITWIAGLIGALVAVGSTWGKLWDSIYGQEPPMWIKTAVLITVVSSWALIAVADILGRAYVSKK